MGRMSAAAGGGAESARVVLITAPDLETARRLARELVQARAAACANIVPGLTSIYRWQGAVQEDAEVLLVVKSRAEELAELERIVARIHPYEVPEIVALEPAAVERRYLDWWLEQTTRAAP
jgi:periplasmic divalent cation tolerance protein